MNVSVNEEIEEKGRKEEEEKQKEEEEEEEEERQVVGAASTCNLATGNAACQTWVAQPALSLFFLGVYISTSWTVPRSNIMFDRIQQVSMLG